VDIFGDSLKGVNVLPVFVGADLRMRIVPVAGFVTGFKSKVKDALVPCLNGDVAYLKTDYSPVFKVVPM
jgi:hypothetical protein